MFEVIVINKITFQSIMKNIKISKIIRLLKKESIERLIILTTGFCIILYGRWTIMGSPPIFQQIDNPASFLTTPIERVYKFIIFSFVYYSLSIYTYYIFKKILVCKLQLHLFH